MRVFTLVVLSCLILQSNTAHAQSGPLIVVNGGGKEHALKTWKLTLGVTRVEGLPDKVGPEFLEFRDDKSTNYQVGISTLIPMMSLRSLEYDIDKKTVTATAVGPDGKDIKLVGTTKFAKINQLAGEGLAEGSKSAYKFQAGGLKGSVTNLRFAGAQPVPASVVGDRFKITAVSKNTHEITGLSSLVHIGTTVRPFEQLFFKTTVKLDPVRVLRLKNADAEDKKLHGNDFEITLNDGLKYQLTFHDVPPVANAQPTKLWGLMGRVPVGYQVFPPHTVVDVMRVSDEKK